MAIAQGIYKTLAYKKQVGLGTPASGSGGQLLRRETATFNKTKDTFTSNEITSHQQYTGDTYSVGRTQGAINGLLSAGTYTALLGSLLRKDPIATSALTSLTLSIDDNEDGTYDITRGTGDFLSAGVKVGDVVRITAGTYTGTARDINLLVVGVSSTDLTVMVPNGKELTEQDSVASSTITVIGKKSWVPVSSHTNDYYTFEEWFDDVSLSRVYSDVQIASANIAVPATGNTTIQINTLGLAREKDGSQVLTTPTAETTSAIISAANAVIMVAGARVLIGTSLNLTIDGQIQHGEPVIGAAAISDIVKGDVRASGSITVQLEDESISDLFDNETPTTIIAALFADTSDTSEFVTFVLPRVKLMGDDIDDGKKQLVMTMPFTGEINGAGGDSLASHKTICSMQDSNA